MRGAGEILSALFGLFDKETNVANLLRRRRLELWPVLAEQKLGLSADAAHVETARHLLASDPDLRRHAFGPLLSYYLHRVFLAAATGAPDLGEAAEATARMLGAQPDGATPIDVEFWPAVGVLWTLPELARALPSVPIGIDDEADRLRFIHHLRGGGDLLRKTCPDIHERLGRDVRWVVPLAEAETGGRHSMTVAHLPGVLFIGAKSGSSLAAELIIHEYLHTVLHGVSETKPLIATAFTGRALYSPWREDARPGEALLHAVYVFTGVLLFWLHHADADGGIGREAQDRVAMLRLQLAPSVEALRASGAGDVLERVAAAAEEAVALAASAPISRDVAESALARTQHHRQRWLETVGGVSPRSAS